MHRFYPFYAIEHHYHGFNHFNHLSFTLEERLTSNREKKFEEAKLADIGVTRDGLDLYQVFKKTLDVNWKESSLIILDDVKISPPYNETSIEKLNAETKDQTLDQVRKLLEKFYTERDQQEIAAAF